LLVRDLEATVNVDQVIEAQLASEAPRPTEGLRREPGEMVDVMWLALSE